MKETGTSPNDELVKELARESDWSEQQSQKVIEILVKAATQQADIAVSKENRTRKTAKVNMTKTLLKSYRQIKESIEGGMENTLAILKDEEYARLMVLEESVKNQQVRSLAIQTASNRLLWERFNAALQSLKEICKQDPDPKFRRYYNLLHDKYIAEPGLTIESLLEKYCVERTTLFRNINEAIEYLSLLLFGVENADELCTSYFDRPNFPSNGREVSERRKASKKRAGT